ncbi:DUF3761 domain-containing protein [Sphingobium nicotianae]|uniref:YehE family protein n=1 Tax=Sphingobium nicotianae TaxID=2782607 RepID=A0A9X1DBW7_9SPHN|nr:YehE family protein [Sphingobium nicotianae]
MKWFLAALALVAASTPSASEARQHLQVQTDCGSGTYVAKSGHRVCRPVRAARTPAGASAQCRDGTWSFSESRRGTCSHHGGVARWL